MKIQMERYEAEMDETKPKVLKEAVKAAADAVKRRMRRSSISP